MKALILLFFSLLAGSVLCQDITMTFSSADENYSLDSITALNIRTGEKITFNGNESLSLFSGTGINLENAIIFDALVYPNPNTGISNLTINVPEQQNIVISVRNQLGQMVCQSIESVQQGSQYFSLSLASAGIYSVQVKHSKGSESFQVITSKNSGQGNKITHLGSSSAFIDNRSLKSLSEGNILPYIFGDPIRFFCMSGIHETIFQDQPREVKPFHYEIKFHPCIDPDGMNYPAVDLGDQVWMADNLAYLSSVSPPSIEDNITGHCYVYGYDGTNIEEAKSSESCKTYGVLYNWEAANNSCPAGWHLSSDEEWKTLEALLGMSEFDLDLIDNFRNSGDIGIKLKSKDNWLNEGAGQDLLGLNLLPGGWSGGGDFIEMGTRASFWTSGEVDDQNAKFRSFTSSNQGNWRGSGGKHNGASVRCLKDEGSNNQPPVASFTVSPESGTNQIKYTVDASACYDDNTAVDDLLIRWDFDYEDDPGWDTDYSSEKIMEIQFHHYDKTYTIRMEVKDAAGFSNITTRKVQVSNMASFIDSRDEKAYKTVLIGTQIWMAENLAWLPSVAGPSTGANDGIFYYVNDYDSTSVQEAKETDNYTTYGALYSWEAAKISCPAGWHLPSDEEWKILEDYLGMAEWETDNVGLRLTGEIGRKLKSTSGWKDNENGIDNYGFRGLPGGWRSVNQGFLNFGEWMTIWTSTPENTNWSIARGLTFENHGIFRGPAVTSLGYSVRCLKDQ